MKWNWDCGYTRWYQKDLKNPQTLTAMFFFFFRLAPYRLPPICSRKEIVIFLLITVEKCYFLVDSILHWEMLPSKLKWDSCGHFMTGFDMNLNCALCGAKVLEVTLVYLKVKAFQRWHWLLLLLPMHPSLPSSPATENLLLLLSWLHCPSN